MVLVYRTAGAWGAGKGANLVPAEIDSNFWDHEQRIDTLETTPPEPNQISNITQTGNTITVHLQDGTSYGPFELPRPAQRPTQTLNVTAATLAPTTAQAMFYFRCSHASGCLVTIPNNTAQAFLVDTELHFRQAGANAVTFESDVGVTLNGLTGYLKKTAAQGAVVTAKKVGTNEWDLFGFLAEDTTTGT